ncbi:hypothetical protein Q9L58_009030 [Maublancomyces gigas]|uniref:ZZ-type domain-containing protein n=1 Tax=Discina gigas TaxID=1032678 RepID=A0ABR3G812_9PEZI
MSNTIYQCDACYEFINPPDTRVHCLECENHDLCFNCHWTGQVSQNPSHTSRHEYDLICDEPANSTPLTTEDPFYDPEDRDDRALVRGWCVVGNAVEDGAEEPEFQALEANAEGRGGSGSAAAPVEDNSVRGTGDAPHGDYGDAQTCDDMAILQHAYAQQLGMQANSMMHSQRMMALADAYQPYVNNPGYY